MSELIFRIKYVFVLSVLLAAFLLFVVWPALNRIETADARIAQLRTRITQARVNDQRVAKGRQMNAELAARIESEVREVPERSQISELMRHIASASESLPLSGQQLSADEAERAVGPYLYTTLQIETTGRFQGVFDLLQHIESLPRTLRVRELRIAHADKINRSEITALIAVDALYQTSHDVPQKNKSAAATFNGGEPD